jgi:hypothetical protein
MDSEAAGKNSQTSPEDQADVPLAFWHSDLLEANLSPFARVVYIELTMRQSCENRELISPSLPVLAMACKCSPATVIHATKELEKEGLVEVARVPGQVHKYRLRSPQEWRQWKERQQDRELVSRFFSLN